jgi:alpha-L-arabinofuranosidase
MVLTSADGDDENSLEQPQKVISKSEEFEVKNSTIHHSFPGNSLTIIRASRKEIHSAEPAASSIHGL